jgi:hypothetical protein
LFWDQLRVFQSWKCSLPVGWNKDYSLDVGEQEKEEGKSNHDDSRRENANLEYGGRGNDFG